MTNTPTGRTAPAELPEDVARIPVIGKMRLVMAPGENRTIDLGILVHLPSPYGWVRLKTDAEQLDELRADATSFLNINDDEVDEILTHLHDTDTDS